MTTFDGEKPQPMDVLETSPEVARKAMLTVAANSADANETRALLVMLGLVEGEEPVREPVASGHCKQCGKPTYSKRAALSERPVGAVREGARGMCSTHYQAELRAGRLA